MAWLVGVILRQATTIAPSVPLPQLLVALAEAARDLHRDIPLKKRLLAALGEGMFYLVTQVLLRARKNRLFDHQSSMSCSARPL